MKWKIVSDSSSNVLSADYRTEYTTVPLKIRTDDTEFADDKNLSISELIDRIEHSTANSTSCPNSQEWADAFEDADCVFAVTISSNLSASYQAAVIAKDQYEEEHPGAKVHIVDSLGTGGRMELIIEKLDELIAKGLSFEEVREAIDEYRNDTHIVFMLESLRNLAKNGRLNKTVAEIAGLLGIRFVGKASEEGTIVQSSIARGQKRALRGILEEMVKLGYEGGKARISHCLNSEAATKLRSDILDRFPQADVLINACGGLCSYYAERGGLIIGFEIAR
ncbi:MAG: DegV family protein [Solobacterium sp.]|jgi:DegV family protein with EDD domain|nr:DegV family protein [Solobacterium sp.]